MHRLSTNAKSLPQNVTISESLRSPSRDQAVSPISLPEQLLLDNTSSGSPSIDSALNSSSGQLSYDIPSEIGLLSWEQIDANFVNFQPSLAHDFLGDLGPQDETRLHEGVPPEVLLDNDDTDSTPQFVGTTGEFEPYIGERLIRLYERFIAPQYPIFSTQSRPSPKSSPTYLLAAIYAIAQPFMQFDDVLTLDLAYDPLPTSALLQISLKALEFEIHGPTLPVVQAFILLLARPTPHHLISDSSFRCKLLGTLISAAHTLGLHMDPVEWSIPRWQATQRRRLSFIIFKIDTWMASSLGRPPLLNEENWLITSMSAEDGYGACIDEADWRDFIQHAQLVSTLRRVLSELHSLRALSQLSSNIQQTLGISMKILEELSIWHNTTIISSSDDAPASVINLLAYHYTHINICRALLRCHATDGQSNPSSTDADMQRARHEAGRCLSNALLFVNKLKLDASSQFWPAWAPLAFSSIVNLMLHLLVMSSSSEEAKQRMQTVLDTRDSLRIRSKQLPILRLGLLRIDSVFWKGLDQIFVLQPHIYEALSPEFMGLRNTV
ncbi:fungal specific transcription factor domain-containing protein [Trichoderma breve]|uniref:Fungal specific transcription factor domain-containing protein n=1 Tax=Trichoderma breve TaxID=2034170 RepID=A0A9W9E4T4_9HYPO|nr:fungal specific transcription factor domain-containing protein [Trichoderma breve]KAJ4854691.1 fungal specific transcription factor domain-containing protein [Trichoderma breve]